jgi:ligand-binding sensor domain-containing protein/signal transduction histidine kinase
VRFDGFHFVRWADIGSAAIPGPVLALAAARDGSLWVGSAAGIFRVQGASVTQFSASDGFQGGVTALVEDRQGAIWAGNRRGLFRFGDRRWARIAADVGYPGAEVHSLHEDRSGRLWVGSAAGVFLRGTTSFELVDPASTNVQSFAEDDSGAIWVTDTSDIVRRLRPHTPRASALPAVAQPAYTQPPYTQPAYAPAIRLPASGWRLLHDRRGRIWVAGLGGGLLRVDRASEASSVVERFDYEDRMAGSPRSLYEDREGNIWVGMRGGLLRISEAVFTSDVTLDGLTQDGARTLAVSADGSVWVATGHSVNRFSGASRVVYHVPQTLALHSDRHDVMWASTAHGLWRMVGDHFVPVPVPQEINWGRVLSITTDTRDTVWLCSALTGVMAWNGERLSTFESEAAVTGRSCASVYGDRRGRVWVGFTGGGVALYDGGTFHSIGPREGLTRGSVLAILEDRGGAVWLGTSAGLSRYQGGRITALTQVNAPLADVVPALVEDDEGYLWVGIKAGAAVIRFHPRELDRLATNPAHEVEYATYDSSDGLPHGPLNWQNGVAGARGGDGRLWFAAGLGVATIDPRMRPPSRPASPPRIEAVSADGRPVSPTGGLVLPFGTSTVRIEYGAISLSAASKLRFRYMLEGLGHDWVSAGSTRDVAFSDLPSGDYRFRLGSTYEGQWTDAAVWDFSIAPAFYLTQGFLLVVACSLTVLLALAWWMRLRAVRGQYALVFAERARLSREIHDTLLQSLAAIGVELETIASQLDTTQMPARDGLRRLRRQVGHSLREARESILDLRRNPMKSRTLGASLLDLAENTTLAKGVPTEFTSDGHAYQGSDEVDVQLFRIAQEAVSNALKHGHATHVRIALTSDREQLVMTVTDNGRGFMPDQSDPKPALGEHLGLLSMRERVERVRGRLGIVSAPGRGTTIEATVPLPRGERSDV